MKESFSVLHTKLIFTQSHGQSLTVCVFVCPTEYSLLSWSGIRMHGLFSHLST